MMRIIEVLYGSPYLLVVILLMVLMGPGLGTIIVALTVTGWVGMARIVRGQVLQIKIMNMYSPRKPLVRKPFASSGRICR